MKEVLLMLAGAAITILLFGAYLFHAFQPSYPCGGQMFC